MNKVEFFIALGTIDVDRFRFRFHKEKGKIIDLVVQYEIFINEKWKAVVRYKKGYSYFLLIRFLDTENENREKKVDNGKKQYVRVRKQFEEL